MTVAVFAHFLLESATSPPFVCECAPGAPSNRGSVIRWHVLLLDIYVPGDMAHTLIEPFCFQPGEAVKILVCALRRKNTLKKARKISVNYGAAKHMLSPPFVGVLCVYLLL